MKKVLQVVAALALVVTAGMMGSAAQAQSTGIGVNPRVDHNIRPGETATGRLLVSNLNPSEELNVDVKVIDFAAYDENGTPRLMTAENAPQTAWSLRPFLTIPTTVTVAPGESTYIDYSVKIPENTGAGSYYSAIQYAARNSGGQVSLNAAPTTLAFVTVPGRATELLTLRQFGGYQTNANGTGSFKSFFMSQAPRQLAYRVENSGTVAENPVGSIIVKNLFGKQVAVIEDANPRDNLALIGQIRRFDVCLKSESQVTNTDNGQQVSDITCQDLKLAPGIYTAELVLHYGINGSSTQEISAKTTFWYMPVWFILIIVVVVALLALGVMMLRKKLIGSGARSRRRK